MARRLPHARGVKRSKPTAYDVARRAGVSQAAVSRAFTPGGSVAAATRERIVAAAAAIGYRPNIYARSLSRGRSDLVGVVMGNPRNPAHVAIFEALSESFAASGRQVLSFVAGEDDGLADVRAEDLLRYQVSALLLIAANISPAIAGQCRAAGIPVIALSRIGRVVDGISAITTAAGAGARAVADHLVARGYRRLAYMAGFSDSVTNREREGAFAARVVEAGLPAPDRVTGHFQRAGTEAAARALLARADAPDAIFCATDYMALAAIDVARSEFGLTIGRHLGVVGFDGIDQAGWPAFDLTTYVQPVDAMVGHALALLTRDALVERPTRIAVEGTLTCRGSTRR